MAHHQLFYGLKTKHTQTVTFDSPSRKLFPDIQFMMCFMIVK